MPDKEALAQAAKFLSRRMMSRSMLCARMLRKGFSEEETEEALEFLARQGYLDDNAFAKAYVSDQKNLRHKGPLRITSELLAHGVDKETIHLAVQSEYPESEQMDQARTLVEKWMKSRGGTEPEKLMARLYRKGFAPGVARTVVEQTCED